MEYGLSGTRRDAAAEIPDRGDGLASARAPLGWEHIGLTGDHLWRIDKQVSKGHFRPLRTPDSRLADASRT